MYQFIDPHQPFMLAQPWAWVLPLVIIWELIWKGQALWKSARNDQPVWFVVLLVLNTVGILPIIYLLFFQQRRPQA